VEERRRHGRGGVIPPSFLTTVQDINVAVGQLARFDARVTGTKPLDVYWLKVRKFYAFLADRYTDLEAYYIIASKSSQNLIYF
jgi:hypothetical protein